MTSAVLAAPGRRRMVVGLLAALMMQGAWLALLRMERQAPHRNEVLTEIWLLPLRPEATKPSTDRSPRKPPDLAPPRPVPDLGDYFPEESPATPPPSTAAPVTPSAAHDGSPAPLRLLLPPERPASEPRRQSMMEQIRNDPRSHTEPRTLEHAMADAAGTLPITNEVSTSGSGSRVIRQGSKCTRVSENRMKNLAPTDERLKDAPSLAGHCYN